MFERFYTDVVRRLRGLKQVERLAKQHGTGFDEFVGNQVLERGQRHCDSEYLGLLYAYRYSLMHFAALRTILPKVPPDVMFDFGGGPGTAMLALAEHEGPKFERLSLEHAKGMQSIAESAFGLVRNRCAENLERSFPDSKFWSEAHRMATGRNVFLVLSYFFAQELTSSFVRALANRVSDLTASTITILYSNPVGPFVSWMPCGGIHDWYIEFSDALRHAPVIKDNSYSYDVLRNLTVPTRRSGECAYEVWKLR